MVFDSGITVWMEQAAMHFYAENKPGLLTPLRTESIQRMPQQKALMAENGKAVVQRPMGQ